MALEVIQSKNRWDKTIKDLGIKDIYYTYEYCHNSAQPEKGIAELLYFENELGAVVYPIVKRKIDTAYSREIYDIVTPYGYGGPLVIGDKGVLKGFREELTTYCEKNNIITEIIRFHPLIKNAKMMGSYCELQYIRKTTAVDLSNDIEEIKSQYSKMNKRNIKRAFKNNLVCKEVNKTRENIEIFLDLYKETMDRQNALSYYYFPYDQIVNQLNNTEVYEAHLLFVYYEDKVISATILYTTKEFAHYYLGASAADYLQLRPNNLIFDYMVELSKEKGCNSLHLGGGYEEDDGLFRYKCSFSNDNVYDYYIGKSIFNQKIYDVLVDERKKERDLKENYFPRYRA